MRKKITDFKKKIVTTITPLRISFIGGGDDMSYFFNKNKRVTMSSSIDKYNYITVKLHKHFNEKYRLNYFQTETVNNKTLQLINSFK